MRQFSEDIFNFVKKHIDSVEQLEILLLFYRNPTKGWTITTVSQEIRTSRTSTQNRLATLSAHGFVAVSGKGEDGEEDAYVYQPESEELHQQVTALEQEYKIRRVRVIDAIYTPPAEEKMMNFLDAFRIRKSEKDE
jgi:predicted transcriptional regulator